jgi:hypothetical protein
VYPFLGREKFVTYNGSPRKGVAGKTPNERWVNIMISGEAIGDFSEDHIGKLLAELKNSNYTPLLGMLGIGGPYSTGLGSAGESNHTAVFSFKKDAEQTASMLSSMVSRLLSIQDVKPQFVDLAPYSKEDQRRFIIEQSGIDCQLFLAHSQK